MTDERCARCGNPLPGANPDNLDVCVPCRTIVGLEIERDELLAEVQRLRAECDRLRDHVATAWDVGHVVAGGAAYGSNPYRQPAEPLPKAEPFDLVAALRASVEAAKERREGEAAP